MLLPIAGRTSDAADPRDRLRRSRTTRATSCSSSSCSPSSSHPHFNPVSAHASGWRSPSRGLGGAPSRRPRPPAVILPGRWQCIALESTVADLAEIRLA